VFAFVDGFAAFFVKKSASSIPRETSFGYRGAMFATVFAYKDNISIEIFLDDNWGIW